MGEYVSKWEQNNSLEMIILLLLLLLLLSSYSHLSLSALSSWNSKDGTE